MISSHETKSQELLSVVGISWIEWIVGSIAIFVLSIRAIIEVFLQDSIIAQRADEIQQSFNNVLSTISENGLVADIASFLIWAVTGLILYSLLWALVVVVVDMLNDVIVANYFVHPSSFHKSSFWLASFSRRIMSITFAVVIIFYCGFLLKSTPYVYESIRSLFSGSSNLIPDLIIVLVNLFFWFAGWHLMVIVRRIGIKVDQKLDV